MSLLVPKTYVQRLAAQAQAEARENFWAFWRYIDPNMLRGWWVEHVSVALQEFYYDFVAGKRPKLGLMAPPQHGKSTAAEDLIAWVAGRNPDCKTIYASYSNELGTTRNSNLQRMMMSERYRQVFPHTRIGVPDWACNSELIEFAGHAGSFRNTTVEGQINGFELNLGVIDDPVKGRAEANSKTVRDRGWRWYTDDWGSRFAANSAELSITTRWHCDDLLGRLIETVGDELKVIAYPAIAERDEKYRKKGDALFPALKPLDFRLARRKVMSAGSGESEYQQHPIIVGGGVIPIEKLRVAKFFDKPNIRASVRYVDKAGTEDDGAYTACVLMHRMQDNTFVISHIARGQWGALEREKKIKTLVDADAKLFKNYEVGIEQEPGSGGKESAEATIRNLAGYRCYADKVTGSKEVRADPFVAQCQNDNVRLVAGDWIRAFYDEAETWPAGKYKDQIDAAAGAFNRLTASAGYDSTY